MPTLSLICKKFALCLCKRAQNIVGVTKDEAHGYSDQKDIKYVQRFLRNILHNWSIITLDLADGHKTIHLTINHVSGRWIHLAPDFLIGGQGLFICGIVALPFSLRIKVKHWNVLGISGVIIKQGKILASHLALWLLWSTIHLFWKAGK